MHGARALRILPASLAACLALASLGGCASSAVLRGPDAAEQPARLDRTRSAVTVESWDPALSAALVALETSPTSEANLRVGLEYRRLGVLDQAQGHFATAAELNPNNAAAFDALARTWRDWGFPEIATVDARRAVELSPASAVTANTLGTVLEASGHVEEARGWYTQAFALDSSASYALSNLCYSAIMAAESDAVEQCDRAVSAAPGSRVALNNLGLAYAASGNMARARELFENRVDMRYAQYNMGIVYMGTRQFEKALAAFVAALQIDPEFARAAARARQAGVYIAAEGRHREDH